MHPIVTVTRAPTYKNVIGAVDSPHELTIARYVFKQTGNADPALSTHETGSSEGKNDELKHKHG